MKRSDLFNRLLKIAERLMLLLPDQLTGSSDTLKRKHHTLYGGKDCSSQIKQSKTHIMASYMCIAAIIMLVLLCSTAEQLSENQEINQIQRPGHGKATESFPVEAVMTYKGFTFTKEFDIKVKHKELTGKEKLELIQSFKERLGLYILGENADFHHISKPLRLPEHDPATGITIKWTSSAPELVSENGEVDLIYADIYNQEVKLKAELLLEDVAETAEYGLTIDAEAGKEDYKRSIEGRLDAHVQRINSNSSPVFLLPDKIDGGIEVRWFPAVENRWPLIMPFLVLALLTVYIKRYDRINREIKEAEEAVIRDLPEFINKLVLLLNAGLVVSAAFSKIVKDYELSRVTENKNLKSRFLYDELAAIHQRMNQTNTFLLKELIEFSKRCGVREMIRLTAVISDNWNKGSLLAEKLEGECELLWIIRKKKAEEKGRLADTKLTLPMMILLVVLIMVTIAPAMMEM